jgi:very-short-patch-repair endonuclease
MRKQTFTGGPEVRIAKFAQRDRGVLVTAELLACGLTHAGIHRRPKTGRSPIHVTVPTHRRPRSVHGISVHRSKTLTARDVTRRDRIPVTTPSWTLRDLKRVLPREQGEAVIDRARSRGRDVSDLVDEAPTRRVLERKFLRLCRRHRIPQPEVNVRVGPFLVDFLRPDSRVIVEVDGYEHHGGRGSFEARSCRDAELTQRGYRVVRFTYRQVTREPSRVASAARRMLR